MKGRGLTAAGELLDMGKSKGGTSSDYNRDPQP